MRLAVLLLLAGCGAPAAAPTKAHDHVRTETTCADACHPWLCEAAWSIDEQADATCEQEGSALCVCRAP